MLENATVGIFFRKLISDEYILTTLPRQEKNNLLKCFEYMKEKISSFFFFLTSALPLVLLVVVLAMAQGAKRER